MIHIIWTNDLDYNDWKDDLENDYPAAEGFTDDDRIRYMHEINEEYFRDEYITLNKKLDNILVQFGEISTWDSKRTGYKILNGSNLNTIFSGTHGDYLTWYVDGENVKCKDVHHDGTNYYTYRVLKKNVSLYDFEDFVCNNSIKKTMEELTDPLGHFVLEIYGLEEEKEK